MSEPKQYGSIPKQGEQMSTSTCAAESFALLNAGAKKHWRGQGDTWTAARDRAAKEAGITPAQAERLQKNWRTMKFPNGDVYRLLRNQYGHLCAWIENTADRVERKRGEIEERNAAQKSNGAAGQGTLAARKDMDEEGQLK